MVTKGEKYILRSDIIYKKVDDENKKMRTFCGEGHLGYIWTATVWNDSLLTSGRDKKIKVWSNKGIKVEEILGHESSILFLTTP
jgi:WD40 repeat protein